MVSKSHRWVLGRGRRVQWACIDLSPDPPYSTLQACPVRKGQWCERTQLVALRASTPLVGVHSCPECQALPPVPLDTYCGEGGALSPAEKSTQNVTTVQGTRSVLQRDLVPMSVPLLQLPCVVGFLLCHPALWMVTSRGRGHCKLLCPRPL